MYRGRLRAERLPASLRTPCELIAWTRPESAQDDANLSNTPTGSPAGWSFACLGMKTRRKQCLTRLLLGSI